MGFLIDNLKDLLLNVFCIFTFFFVYHKFIEGKIRRISNEFLIFVVAGILIVLCMSLQKPADTGHLFDLRQVPLIIGALYGGRKVVFLLFIILITHRFYLNDVGFFGAFTAYSMLLVSLWYMIPWFNKSKNIQQKVYISFLASCLGLTTIAIVIPLTYPIGLNLEFVFFLLVLVTIQCLTIITFVFFIEKSKLNMFMENELKKLEKLNTISEIAASISHEVRNPLTVTRGFIQLLRDDKLTEEKRNQYIHHSLNELDMAERIISDYLTFAKPSLENIKIVDLNKELDYVINLINPYASMNNVLIVFHNNNKENVRIIGEVQKIHQCFINIIKNAVEAISQGGQITIHLNKASDNTIIIIEDSGMGMDAAQIAKLGTPYYTTKSRGTGLGTMVTFSIVKAMKGKIEVESELGKGTCFTISLPTVVDYN
ncbi:MAG TPA: ATP-binding protein [Bacilli bacterium]